MDLIQTVTVGSGGAASIEFGTGGTIPTTYTDLYLVLSLRSNNANIFGIHYLRVNGSTSGYTSRYLEGTGSSRYAGATTVAAYLGASTGNSSTANTFANIGVHIANYRAAIPKSILAETVGENNATTAYQTITTSLWNNTDPITSIQIGFDGSNTFLQHSSASLYGILKGSDGVTTVS